MPRKETAGLKSMALIRANLQRLGLLETCSALLVECENYFEPCHSMPRGHVEVIYTKLMEHLTFPDGFTSPQEVVDLSDGEFITISPLTKENLEAFLTYHTFEGWRLLFEVSKGAQAEDVSVCINDICDTVLVLSMQLYIEGSKILSKGETTPNACFKKLEYLFYKELGNMYMQLSHNLECA